jgi:hypothetical protein
MTPARARLAIAGVFVLGFLAGAATLLVVRARIERRLLDAPDPLARIVVYKLNRELRLTPAQRREVFQVMADSRAEALAASADVLPRLIAVFDRTQARIRELLTPAQQERFDRLVAERRRLLSRVVPPRPPAPR